MSCEALQGRIPDWILGRLGPIEAQELESHVAECARCREFAEAARAVYGIPLADRWEAMARERTLRLRRGPRPGRRGWTGWARVAALILVSVGIFTVIDRWWSHPRSSREAPTSDRVAEFVPLPFPVMSLELPPLPTALAEGWITSRAEAETLSRFGGRPILVEYASPFCPLCAQMKQQLETDAGRDLLSGFVLLRQEYDRESLAQLAKPVSGALFPPVFEVRYEELATEPEGGLTSLEQLAALLAGWSTIRQQERSGRTDQALPPAEFRHAAELLAGVPRQLEEGRIRAALETLHEVRGLGDRFDTDFASLAGRLLEQLHTQLERVAADLRALSSGTADDRTRARDLARRLAIESAGWPVADRLSSIAQE
ncbi:MAG: zf-HC2 domain-containing protein [Planctomycetota bacterium]